LLIVCLRPRNPERESDVNVVYIDGLTIEEPGQLALLCLIYDKVSLPHPYDHDPDCEEVMRISFKNEEYLEKERHNYLVWKTKHKELFDAGAMSVLPAPIAVADLPNDIEVLLSGQMGPGRLRLGTDDLLHGRIALAMHAIYCKSDDPEFKMRTPSDTSTAAIREQLGQVAIGWRAPMLPKLQTEQILELRSETERFRDGFVMYLDSLADEVEDEMGTKGASNRDTATKIFERKVRPDVAEFIRKGLPQKIAWWGSIVRQLGATGGTVIKTVVHPFNFSNYFKLVESIGSLVESVAGEVAHGRSNKRHAAQYLARINAAKLG
jgi:hypothetical protein